MTDSPVEPGVAELLMDADRPGSWMLLVDGTPQSHVDLADPLYLDFEYMRRLGHVVDLAAPAGKPLRVLHLGAGALTLARYVAATRRGSTQLAVDSDEALVALVRTRLPLDQPSRRTGSATGAGRVRVRVGDARAVLEELPAGSFDVVVSDLFAGATTAAHLTSAEFTAAAARALAPAGIYAVNIGDGPVGGGQPLAHTRARVATDCSIFPAACLIADPGVLKGRRFGNLVLAASRQPLPVAELGRRVAGDPFPGRVLHGAELERFAAGARLITDEQPEASPAPPADTFAVSELRRR